MTNKTAEIIASMLEEYYPKQWLKKDHVKLSNSILFVFKAYPDEVIANAYTECITNSDSLPTPFVVKQYITQHQQKKTHARYFKDSDGCGYLWNGHDYDCIWKWWWHETRGLTEMQVLKQYGLIAY